MPVGQPLNIFGPLSSFGPPLSKFLRMPLASSFFFLSTLMHGTLISNNDAITVKVEKYKVNNKISPTNFARRLRCRFYNQEMLQLFIQIDVYHGISAFLLLVKSSISGHHMLLLKRLSVRIQLHTRS